jgi:hypothetical protein
MNKSIVSVLALAACAGSALAGNFTFGNLVVYRVGDGSSTLGNSAVPTFLDEYTPLGTLVQSIALPTSASGSNKRCVLSGSSVSEGQLTRSADGRYLTFGGYDAAVGTASVGSSTSAAAARVMARVGSDGAVDTSTTTTAFSGNQIRGVVSNDGSQFWATGGNGGVQYASYGGTSSSQINTATGASTNNRCINIFGGNLYISSGSTNLRGVGQIGSGLPTTNGQGMTVFQGPNTASTSSSPYDFILASANVLYIADDSAVAGVGGLQRWDLSSGTWTKTQNWVPGNGGKIRQLTSTTDGSGNNVLYMTVVDSSNVTTIQSLTDVGGTSTFNVIATGSALTAFRGIEFAPVPAPGSLALLGLGGLVAGRRRR